MTGAGADAQLAQANLARLRLPMEAAPMAGFVAALDAVNALADRAPGFVWRHRGGSDGHLSPADPAGDPLLILNLSVWQDYESLHEFTYRSAHAHFLRRRAEWFSTVGPSATVLWWVRAGHRPTPDDGLAHLRHLRRYGPTPQAFGVRVGPDRAIPLRLRRDRAVPARTVHVGRSSVDRGQRLP